MKVVNKKTVIRSIKRSAGRNGLPGNFIVNGNLWINSREIRNSLIGAGLPADVSPIALVGATLTFDEITIEPTDVANNESVKHTINGREVTFKKVGVNNVAAEIDYATLNVDEKFLNLCKTGAMATERRLATMNVAPVRRAAASMQNETLTEDQPETQNTPANENEPVDAELVNEAEDLVD